MYMQACCLHVNIRACVRAYISVAYMHAYRVPYCTDMIHACVIHIYMLTHAYMLHVVARENVSITMQLAFPDTACMPWYCSMLLAL